MHLQICEKDYTMIWIEASIDFVTTHVGEKEREIVLKMKVFEDRPSKKSSSIKEEDTPEEAARLPAKRNSKPWWKACQTLCASAFKGK